MRALGAIGARLFRRKSYNANACARSFARPNCNAALSLNAHSFTDTNGICRVIASHLKGGDVVQLIGKVGAGKTATARGIIRALLQNEDEVVQSPTFSLALSYDCMFSIQLTDSNCATDGFFACTCSRFQTIHHIDAYRQAVELSTLAFTLDHFTHNSGWSNPAPF